MRPPGLPCALFIEEGQDRCKARTRDAPRERERLACVRLSCVRLSCVRLSCVRLSWLSVSAALSCCLKAKWVRRFSGSQVCGGSPSSRPSRCEGRGEGEEAAVPASCRL